MRRCPLLLGIAIMAARLAADDGYVILDGSAGRADFKEAVRRLAVHRGATVVPFDPGDLAAASRALTREAPAFVAVVLPPELIELDLQRRFLQMATEVDEDPFVDFAYGYVTGATGKDALGLVEAGIRAEREPRPFTHGSLCGGGKASTVSDHSYPLRGATLPGPYAVVKGEGEEHDREFVARVLPRLGSCGVVEFVGHGMPRHVAGGPDWRDLEGWTLDASAVLSVPCFTGVTRVWYEEDWRAGVLRRREIPLEESFCLRVLAAGACGYTAYLCGRPAGPELYTDLLRLVVDGTTLGEARRRDYDKTVLGFLGYGEQRVKLKPLADGQPLARERDAVRDIMLEGALGGVLFGDPASRPFTPRPGLDPVRVEARAEGAGITIELSCPRASLWSLCGDQTARFGDSMALRAYARVPLGDVAVGEVEVDSCRFGARDASHRLLWAVEEDQGERWLQLKVMFSRAEAGQAGDFSARVTLRRAEGEGSRWGGETAKPERQGQGGSAPARDLGATEVDPALEKAAARFGASRKALEAALRATAAALGKGDRPAEQALAELAKLKGDGFRATCALLLVGHHHYRTWELIRATFRSGDEKLLLELCEEDLPALATWSALEGLGATGCAKGRAYLLDRLAKEKDLGLFMSAAQGLAHMGERKAVPLVAKRLFEAEGVEVHLVLVLGRLGGPDARKALEAYVQDARARHVGVARRCLEQLQ
jgi:hypothetical protein